MDFISVILTEMKFQTGMRFSCEHNLPETKWISADLLDVAVNVHVRLKLRASLHDTRGELKPVWNLKPLLKSRSVYMAIYMEISLWQLSKQ